MLSAWTDEPSVLSAWGNQAVQSILFMNTDQELGQEGGEEYVQYRKKQLKVTFVHSTVIARL